MSAIIDLSGITRGVSRLGSAVVRTVQPITHVIEMASESSAAWTVAHSANLAAKSDRQAQVRDKVNNNLLRKALATAEQGTINVNEFVRNVETSVAMDQFKAKIHDVRCSALVNMDEKLIQSLAERNNLTDADILKAAKVGSAAAQDTEDSLTISEFDLSRFKTISE